MGLKNNRISTKMIGIFIKNGKFLYPMNTQKISSKRKEKPDIHGCDSEISFNICFSLVSKMTGHGLKDKG
jgi:hypothetical protein